MSRIVYFDCASGASGDMILGALVDLGMPLEELRADLARLALGGVRLESVPVSRCGVRATRVKVMIDEEVQPHRGLKEIRALIAASGLDVAVRERATALFERLAEVEGWVHGIPPSEVHFHEVGAADSIADVVLGVAGLARLGASRFVASPMNVGSGTVTIAHGTFAIPPPATTMLVAGAPVYGVGKGELLTPTGALLITGHATSYGPLPPLRLEKSGCGAGEREMKDRPNVLRLLVGEETEGGATDLVVVLECALDDMTPELIAAAAERLLEQGALDVYVTPVLMKKGRPGHLLTVLAPPERRLPLEETLFAETSTLGVRRQELVRSTLARESVSVETPWGAVRIKLGRRGERIYNAQPEFEDCRRVARASGVSLKDVQAAALAAWRRREK